MTVYLAYICRRYLKYCTTRIAPIREIFVVDRKMAVKAYKDIAHLLELFIVEDISY